MSGPPQPTLTIHMPHLAMNEKAREVYNVLVKTDTLIGALRMEPDLMQKLIALTKQEQDMIALALANTPGYDTKRAKERMDIEIAAVKTRLAEIEKEEEKGESKQ